MRFDLQKIGPRAPYNPNPSFSFSFPEYHPFSDQYLWSVGDTIYAADVEVVHKYLDNLKGILGYVPTQKDIMEYFERDKL